MLWLIFIIGLGLAALGGLAFMKQLRSGLTGTGLSDNFTWGLYIQAFFFFSSISGGLLVWIGAASLLESSTLRPLMDRSAALSFGALAAAGMLIGADVGKPFRSMRILTAFKVASPMTWDFYMLSACGILNLVYLLGLVPASGPWLKIWGILCLLAALTFIMIHTMFFLSRVEAGFKSQPFLALDTLAQSLWGGAAAIALLASIFGSIPNFAAPALLALTVLVLMPQLGGTLASLSTKLPKSLSVRLLLLNLIVLVILLVDVLNDSGSAFTVALASVLALAAVFLEKFHLVKHFQKHPTLPEPYSQFQDRPTYAPTKLEWMLAGGGLGVTVVVCSVIIFIQ